MSAKSPVQLLEEALIRDSDDAVERASHVPAEELLPILSKYAHSAHPFGTRERVLRCLESRDEARAVSLLVSFLAPGVANDQLRAQAASILAEKPCAHEASNILDYVTRDLQRILQSAPALLGVARTGDDPWRAALRGFRRDVEELVAIADEASSSDV